MDIHNFLPTPQFSFFFLFFFLKMCVNAMTNNFPINFPWATDQGWTIVYEVAPPSPSMALTFPSDCLNLKQGILTMGRDIAEVGEKWCSDWWSVSFFVCQLTGSIVPITCPHEWTNRTFLPSAVLGTIIFQTFISILLDTKRSVFFPFMAFADLNGSF